MKLAPSDLRQLADLAIAAASEAGQMVSRSRPIEVEHKADGPGLASQVVTEIDRQSQQIILDMLSPTLTRFELGLLSEEQDDDGSRMSADYFWSIDPLDGTLPFIEGIPGYAVSIALVQRDGTPCIGVIYDPTEATLWHAISGGGAFRDRRPWSVDPVPSGGMLSVFADRSFLQSPDHRLVVESLETIAQDMDLDGVRVKATGGAVMNALQVLVHPPACYFKRPKLTGGGSLWDFAATACIFAEVGAVATAANGEALDLNRPDSYFMNHQGVMFATNDSLAERVRGMLFLENP